MPTARLVAAALAGAVLLGCSQGAEPFFPAPSPEDVVGQYALAAVNGQPIPGDIPTTVGGQAMLVRVTRSTLVLTEDGRYGFLVESDVRPVGAAAPGEPSTQSSAGRYQLSGSLVLMADTTGAQPGTTPRQAEYAGRGLRLGGIAGTVWDYRRP